VNILLVILKADPSRGGAERYTVDLAQSLSRRGHSITIAATEFDIPDNLVKKVELHSPALTKIGRYAQFLTALENHLAKDSYDIVHAMLPVRRCDIYHPHAGIAADAIVTGHQKHSAAVKRNAAAVANRLNLKRRRFADVERDMIAHSSPIVLCLSDYVASVLHQHYPSARAEKLFNAVDLEKFNPTRRIDAGMTTRRELGISASQTVALMIAQDFERKGLRETLLALKQLDDEKLTLIVVGKENPSAYQKLARTLGLDRRVIFAGATSDPYAFYKAADFFILPTRHDPCSLVVLEALAMGLPVISTVKNGACEIMTDGVHGTILPDPQDVSAITSALRTWTNPGLRLTASEACLALRPMLSMENHLSRLESLYGQTVSR
jgi:UDP-glucose:(heptosyl)LPS alpha-1,3-glucosyltransferase